ncbi:MAG: hypothetical protein JST05_07250 [Acidobacteria bacterium]|nr:hypothetical protein [Acidobacteriota bacterium]
MLDRLQFRKDFIIRIDTDRILVKASVELFPDSAAISVGGQKLISDQVSAVWLRRPKPLQVSKEEDPGVGRHIAGEWAESLENYLAFIPRERWFNHPSANAFASRKMLQLHHAKRVGLRAPKTTLTHDPVLVRSFWEICDGRVVIKPINSGYVEYDDGRLGLIYTNRMKVEHLAESELIRACPVLYQELVEEKVDVRVTWVDGLMMAVAMRRPEASDIDIRRENMKGVQYSEIAIPVQVEEAIRSLMAHFGLKFAAIDFGITIDGEWVFFEINPNGQWAWMDLAGGMNLWKLFETAFFPESPNGKASI